MEKIEEHSKWEGTIHREEAEAILEGQKVGTYLIRGGDEESTLAVSELEKTNECQIHHALLTYVSGEEKISEKLLLHVSWGWLLYQDEPNLKGVHYQVYSTLEQLLDRGFTK